MSAAVEAYVALCRECRGMHAATVADQKHPDRYLSELRRWARWKSQPLIETATIEEVRAGRACHVLLNPPGPHATVEATS